MIAAETTARCEQCGDAAETHCTSGHHTLGTVGVGSRGLVLRPHGSNSYFIGLWVFEIGCPLVPAQCPLAEEEMGPQFRVKIQPGLPGAASLGAVGSEGVADSNSHKSTGVVA